MAIQNILDEVKRGWSSLVKTGGKKTKQLQPVFVIALIVAGVAVGYYSYKIYTRSRNEAAFGFLADYIQEYERKADQIDSVDWSEVSQSLELEVQQYSGTTAAPLFCLYKAEHLVRQGERAQALSELDGALKALPADSVFIPLYKTKRSLVLLDMNDAAAKETALTTLHELAHDTTNSYRDCSAYYLGRYYWITGDIAQAQKVWQALVDSFAQNNKEQLELLGSAAQSPWAERAKVLLEQIA